MGSQKDHSSLVTLQHIHDIDTDILALEFDHTNIFLQTPVTVLSGLEQENHRHLFLSMGRSTINAYLCLCIDSGPSHAAMGMDRNKCL
jgi:hypothetical protein